MKVASVGQHLLNLFGKDAIDLFLAILITAHNEVVGVEFGN